MFKTLPLHLLERKDVVYPTIGLVVLVFLSFLFLVSGFVFNIFYPPILVENIKELGYKALVKEKLRIILPKA